jgi:uncharacterized membrane protein
MNKDAALGFVKTTFVGGLVFLVPVVILVVLLSKAGAILRRLAQPLAALLPVHRLLGVVVADVIVVVAAVAICFFAGLLARVSFANRFVKTAETGVLWSIPGYAFVKALTDNLDRHAAGAGLSPVLVHFDDYAQLAFEVDRLPDGRRVIYLPSAPNPRAGTVVVVDADRVEAVQMSFIGAIRSLRTLGRGVAPSLRPSPTSAR